jgi:hypothetical protein
MSWTIDLMNQFLVDNFHRRFDNGMNCAYSINIDTFISVSGLKSLSDDLLNELNELLSSSNLFITYYYDKLVVDKLAPILGVRQIPNKVVSRYYYLNIDE